MSRALVSCLCCFEWPQPSVALIGGQCDLVPRPVTSDDKNSWDGRSPPVSPSLHRDSSSRKLIQAHSTTESWGSKVRQEAAEVLADQDSETTRCHVGLILLVKGNQKLIQIQEKEINSTSRGKE